MSLHGLSKQAWNRYAAGGSWRYDIVAPGLQVQPHRHRGGHGPGPAGAVRRDALSRAADRPPLRRRRSRTCPWSCRPCRSGVELRLAPLRRAHRRSACVTRSSTGSIERGIGTSVHFIPLHLHSYYRDTFGERPDDFPVATAQFERAVSLPIWSAMTDGDVERVVAAVRDTVAETRMIAITGGFGFLGWHLACRLRALGATRTSVGWGAATSSDPGRSARRAARR